MIQYLQLERTYDGSIASNGTVVFDAVLSGVEGLISYNTLTGKITFSADGLYYIGWFVATEFGQTTNGSNFAIVTSDGETLTGSSHVRVSSTTGFAIVEVAVPGKTARLVNTSDNDLVLSQAVNAKAALVVYAFPEPIDFISEDAGNAITLGSDNKLHVSSDICSVQTVNNVAPDVYKNISLSAVDIPFDNSLSQGSPAMLALESLNVQDAIDELDKYLRYNAIYTFDATQQSAPPNLPRGYNWHVDIQEPLMNDHQYSRYFYLTPQDAALDKPGSPNIGAAVARWFIDGRHMGFEYLENGVVHTVVDITSPIDGSVLIPIYRPIPIGETWFFGQNQADPFPETDTVRSIVDINVQGLTVMLGNTFDLTTTSKQIVGAINELNSKVGVVEVYEAQDVTEALTYSQNHPNVFVFVAKA